MTTIGVTPAVTNRTLPMNMASYAYQYPSTAKVKLAAVKEGLFHPNLPTFRRMDMDTAAHKLSETHCRTSTELTPEDFRRATTSIFTPTAQRLHSAQITSTGRLLHNLYTTPEELKKARIEWSEFLNKSPERFNIRLPELPENKNLHFSGYAVRYLRPEVTTSWRYTLRQEPAVDKNSQRPVPATVYSRYRDSHPQFSRNVATEAWRC